MDNSIWFPDKEVQDAHWQRKDDEYEQYISDLHARQHDPDYIRSYSEWLDQVQPLPWDGEDIEEWQRQSEGQGTE